MKKNYKRQEKNNMDLEDCETENYLCHFISSLERSKRNLTESFKSKFDTKTDKEKEDKIERINNLYRFWLMAYNCNFYDYLKSKKYNYAKVYATKIELYISHQADFLSILTNGSYDEIYESLKAFNKELFDDITINPNAYYKI